MSRSTFRGWLRGMAVYRDRRLLTIFFLGFSSGLPLALTFGTLTLWLAEAGITKTAIGLFALTGTPYTLKFVWSPLVDRLEIPFLTRRLGRRRGWALASQLALMAAILLLGASRPEVTPQLTALLALLVAFLSATQDIAIDAYRVEILEEHQYGAGAAMIVLGYRIGMLASGAGALYVASFFDWFIAYAAMAALMLVGVTTVLNSPEPAAAISAIKGRGANRVDRLMRWIREAVIGPFAEFMGRRGWLMVLLFILLYKLGDALAGVMANPFYVDLQFTKIEIANISKVFGLSATIAGGLIGGVIAARLGIIRSLFVCGLLQMVSNLMFVLLALSGRNLSMLTLTIGVENLSGGMGTAAFVAYLSSLCNVAYTATQYALLSSFMAFGRTLLSSSGGWFADRLDWVSFFVFTTAAALPGLIMVIRMKKLTAAAIPGRDHGDPQ